MSEYTIPLGLLGSERDPEPWETFCIDHGLQTGRLIDTPNLEASSLGVCEVCLQINFVRCKDHGIVERTERGECARCFAAGQRADQESLAVQPQAQPPVAPSPPAPPATRQVDEIRLPPVGMDPQQALLAGAKRHGPAPFAGFTDGDGGGREAGTIPGRPSDGAGHPAAGPRFTLAESVEGEEGPQAEGQPEPQMQPLREVQAPVEGLSDLALTVRRAIDARPWRSLGRERSEAASPTMNDSEGA